MVIGDLGGLRCGGERGFVVSRFGLVFIGLRFFISLFDFFKIVICAFFRFSYVGYGEGVKMGILGWGVV